MREVSVDWETDEKIAWYLDAILRTGLFGETLSEVIQSLVRRSIAELVKDGLIDTPFPRK